VNIIIYIVAAAMGLYLSLIGLVFALLHGLLFTFIIGASLLTAHIAAFLYVRKKAMEGKGRLAALALVLPMIVVAGGALVITWGIEAVSFLVTFVKPDSAAFRSECRTAGAQFYKLPTSPVHSIAYDWTSKKPPPYNEFSVMVGTRVSPGYSEKPYPPSIEFVEGRRSKWEGRPLNGPDGQYFRRPKVGARYAITDLTADVLVMYRVGPEEELEKAEEDQGLVTYEVTVTDRRTSERLASLRYAIDAKNMRGCGLTDDNTMNVRSFVLKSIGVQ
jgi:hypothetical protein